MKTIVTIALAILVGLSWQHVSAEEIPVWVKNNAKWWADGTIGDSDFVQGIQYLVTRNIIKVPETAQGTSTSSDIPAWVKNNAKWWADGTISDGDFIQGIQFLIKNGIVVVDPVRQTQQTDTLESKLEACRQKETQRQQYECETQTKAKYEVDQFKTKAKGYAVGPITFYYAGAKVESSADTDVVNLKFLVENTGSSDNITLFCTGPAVCNYDLTDGKTTYKYAAHDFTNGQVVLKPGQSRFINMLFGPAIGYGSYTDFEFDPSREYKFNVKEPWGSASIPLDLH